MEKQNRLLQLLLIYVLFSDRYAQLSKKHVNSTINTQSSRFFFNLLIFYQN